MIGIILTFAILHFSKELREPKSDENDSFISELKEVHPDDWDRSHEYHALITDGDLLSSERAEYVIIFKDGVIFAGKNMVYLKDRQIEEVKRLYERIDKYKKRKFM